MLRMDKVKPSRRSLGLILVISTAVPITATTTTVEVIFNTGLGILGATISIQLIGTMVEGVLITTNSVMLEGGIMALSIRWEII
jgi:hypothetical protein